MNISDSAPATPATWQRFSILVVCALLACCLPVAAGQDAGNEVTGIVRDDSGAVVAEAKVMLRLLSSGATFATTTGDDGRFRFLEPARGEYELLVELRGFATARKQVRHSGGRTETEVQLSLAAVLEEVRVTATRVVGTPEIMERLPGSVEVISAAALTESRAFTTEEALRRVPGLHARAEEGFGLRPNIGIRGLSPTRSTQVLLLEDGLPLSFAPYGDNASYYHPPIDRFDGVEVVKGGGQILYGPRTVGAVINYLTPPPPEKWGGSLTLVGGTRDYVNAHLRAGGTMGKTGVLFDVLRKQGRGARENLRHGIDDFNVKTLTQLGTRQSLTLRFNRYTEDSRVTYSGLRQAEFDANPRGNPFRNDSFDAARYGASARHSWAPRDSLLLTSSAYATWFSRDWWRQSSNSNQRPNDQSDSSCNGMTSLNSTCGNEGRLRDYSTYGLESRGRAEYSVFGRPNTTDVGVRWHAETQERRQENGPLPASRSGVLVEDNRREARAASFFVQDRLVLSALSITPGVRVERIWYERLNRLGNGGQGAGGDTDLTAVMPSVGLAYTPSDRFTVFAGVHQGFAPPRVEDVISNSTGASVDLDPERSWNYEVGVRSRPLRALRLDAAFFRMDFDNQIVPASVAGGLGATLTNAGRTLHQGMELATQVEWRDAFGTGQSLYWRTSYTWLPIARFESERTSAVSGFSSVRITGNRLPYAAENLLSSSVTWVHRRGMTAMVEGVYTGRQFADDLNTVGGSADGQRGLLPGNAIWNLTVNYPVEGMRTTLFFSAKNLFDRLNIADRSRGILPGAPRIVQAGLQWGF